MTKTAEGSQQKEDEEPTVGEKTSELLREVRSRRRRFSRVKNLLTKIEGNEPDVADYETWLEVRRGLEGYELGIEEIDEARRALVDRMASIVDRLSIKARMKFTTKLDTLASSRQLEVEKVSENPLVVYLEPLTFEVDFDEGNCRMLYGHEPVDELPLEASALIEAHEVTTQRFSNEAVDAELFFDLLYNAYRTVLVADGAKPGERVDLVDVLVPLGMLRADRDALRKEGPEAIEPFSRPMLAYQLAMLRSDGMLEKNGVRLELGAATGGSTRDKTNVLYIPIGASGGQYYGSLRFEE